MKRMLIALVAPLAALGAAAAIGAATTTVQITKNGLTPKTIVVTAGDTVTWHNSDSKSHQVVADNGSFASPVLSAGQSWSFTPGKAGAYKYRDSYATTHTATLTVKAPPATLTLGSSLSTVIYGSSTQLNGQVSNQLGNQPVTLSSQQYGKSVQSVQSTTTQSSGTFIFGVTPTISTTYTAHSTASNSNPVTVGVAPRVGFGRSGRTFIAKVTSDLSYSGKYVMVQKKNRAGGWYTFKRLYLGDSSRATFLSHLAKGAYTLRLYLPASQAGLGYVQSVSRLLTVTLR
jgi:plastocyanin